MIKYIFIRERRGNSNEPRAIRSHAIAVEKSVVVFLVVQKVEVNRRYLNSTKSEKRKNRIMIARGRIGKKMVYQLMNISSDFLKFGIISDSRIWDISKTI